MSAQRRAFGWCDLAAIRRRSVSMATSWLPGALWLLVGMSVLQIAGAQQAAIERQVKAAYLFKFGSYITWPDRAFPAADSPIRIGVLGADDLAEELAQMAAGKTVNGRPLSIRRIQRDEALPDLNVLFVSRSHKDKLDKILAATRGQSIVTVSDFDDYAAHGSMINFVIVDGRLRFEISLRPAQQENISISARLLAAAHRVTTGPS
ncbi:hypothetical protein BH11PSE11_BH11PSE11_10320 [soil metagenome]